MDIIQLDQAVTLWINNLGSCLPNSLWYILSDAKVWFPAYGLVMAFMIWKLGWKKGLIVVASIIACIILTDQLSNLVKSGFQRLRPCYNPAMLEGGVAMPYGQTAYLYGFFSSHAANVFGFASVTSLGLRLNGEQSKAFSWGVYIWASLVSLSRIMMAAHFLGDVLTGVAFGLVIGVAVAFAAHLLIKVLKLL